MRFKPARPPFLKVCEIVVQVERNNYVTEFCSLFISIGEKFVTFAEIKINRMSVFSLPA